MDELDKRLVRELQGSLPQAENPYLELGLRLGISEDEVVERLKVLKESGRLKRIAAILRHQKSGYASNAMAVFLVPDDSMDMLGGKLAESPLVSHCYERVGNECWPYNLYAMVHGTHRQAVMAVIQRMTLVAGLDGCPREVLFSTRRFKQTGARRFRGWHAADSAAPAPEADHAHAR